MAGDKVDITRADRGFRIVALVLYWIGLILLAHIRIPRQIQESGLPDKGLHILAYMGLTMLLWGAARPTQRVDWRGASAWVVLLVVVLYGLLDEWSQRFIAGRTADPMDLVADALGALATLGMMRFLWFWDAAMALLAGGLIVLTNICWVDLKALMPGGDYVFYLIGYGAFATMWVFTRSKAKGLLFWTVPSCLILANGLLGTITGLGPGVGHILVAFTITIAALAVGRLSYLRPR